MIRKLSIHALVGSILLLSSCIKEKFDPGQFQGILSVNPGVAVPIGTAHMTLQRYLNSSAVSDAVIIAHDGFITLVYQDQVLSVQASECFSFPGFSYTGILNNPLTVPIVPSALKGTEEIADTLYLSFPFSSTGAELDSMLFSSADLSIQLGNPNQVDGTVTVEFPGIIRNGTVYSKTLVPGSGDRWSDLGGYSVRLDPSQSQKNLLQVIVKVSISNNGISIPPGGTVQQVDMGMSNIRFSAVYGYLGQVSIPIDPGSFRMSLYNAIPDGNFFFADPRLKISFSNSFGFPVATWFRYLYAATAALGNIPFTSTHIPGINQPKIIGYPLPAESGTTKTDSIILNGSNSNLPYILSQKPESIFYADSLLTNPDGYTHSNFALDTSRFGLALKVELPLYGNTDYLLMYDSMNFDFSRSAYNTPDEVKSIHFQLSMVTDMPVEIEPQVFFADASFHVLDSLFNVPAVIRAADIDAEGKAIPTRIDPIWVDFPPERLPNIENARYLIARGKVRTGNAPLPVKFYDGYFFDVSLGAVIGLQMKPGF